MVSAMTTRRLHLAISSLLIAIPSLAAAQDTDKYRCTYGELTRRIEIVRETGVTVPCEVHYYKDTEAPGEQQVLWQAQREEGYCEARTIEFVQQLSDWGWACDEGATDPAATSTEEAADDDADEA